MVAVLLLLGPVALGRGGPLGSVRAGGAATAPVTVRVLMPAPFADATAEPVREFNAGHPGLQLEVVRGPLDSEVLSDLAVSSLLLGDTPYDLLLVDQTWTARFAAAGWLAPLEPLLGDDALDGMVPGARKGTRFDGHLWRLPLQGDTGLLYWRTDLMERPPRDTAELERIARRLQRQGRVRWGYVWPGRQYEGLSCVVNEVLEAFGARWWQNGPGQAGGSPSLNDPRAVAAVGWLRHLIDSGVTPPAVAGFAENESLQLFASGQAAFLRNWPYAYALLQQNDSTVRGRVGIVPLVGAPGRRGGGTLGSWGLTLLHGSAHPRQAAEVMRWLCGETVQRHLALRYGYAPTWASLYEDPELQRQQPLLVVQAQALASAVARPTTPLYAQLSDGMQRSVNGLLTGQGTAPDAMAAVQRQSEMLLRASAAALPPRRNAP
ncbi:MAG: ABC transporter substrate-binding protein [Synechococcaceae cyanobacterium]|nr:ABC transporter substrate-binding protein [Synechococcaceae cyanobacterium]